MTPTETALYLRTLPAIRERCTRVLDLATQNKLQYFEYRPENEHAVTDFCVQIIHKTYGTDYASIPPHGRWRHSDAGHPRIAPLLAAWAASPAPPSPAEVAARLVDHFTVSVLLDAGAGSAWVYTEPETGEKYSRSEGLGVAAVHMFARGLFSSIPDQPYCVDAAALARLTPAALAEAFQVTEANPMVGLEGRAGLLVRLAEALKGAPEFFGSEARPGGIVEYLKSKSTVSANGVTEVPLAALWHALITGLQPIWPGGRGELAGMPLGDVWVCPALGQDAARADEPGATLVPFHKLTGWLAYSLREPLEKILGWKFVEQAGGGQTGLPEYRNGGLFLDLDVLRLRSTPLTLTGANGEAIAAEELGRDEKTGLPRVAPGHPAIVEWRAMTVVLLDRTLLALRTALPAPELTLAQALESATWAGGRAIAAKLREGGGPPIEIVSDGTVF
ncbi:hypothetical protein B0H14DRAFT_2930869 [Mycena olivaceomarginata]|nr:hypothetical protein B0H14DRAFT_2930869 [Mycena olivaceomarginata]